MDLGLLRVQGVRALGGALRAKGSRLGSWWSGLQQLGLCIYTHLSL